jgi:RNA polymerase sigma-70 factor
MKKRRRHDPVRLRSCEPAKLRTFELSSPVWLDDSLVQRLYARAKADRWHLPTSAFASFLIASAQKEFGDQPPDTSRVERFCSSLHLEDLALACACAEGVTEAWDDFIVRYRPGLYRAADALDPSGGAREVADSLYAELFGLKSRGGERQSHLRYFHGRSSLATWLRAVLAQRYIDHRRIAVRVEALPDEDAHEPLAASRPSSSTPALLHFIELIRHVITAAVSALSSRDRLRLRCYYIQDMTLAQIGKLLGESEATASRGLARSRRAIREEVERALRAKGLSETEIDEGFAAVSEDAGPLDLAELLADTVSAEARERSR